MRILIALHDYTRLRGVQVFSHMLAVELGRRQHEVALYSPHIGGEIAERTAAPGLTLHADLRQLRERTFDAILVNASYATACEVRFHFPRTPLVLVYHTSAGPPNLPVVDLRIAGRLAVSEEVRDASAMRRASRETILLFRSIVDTDRFQPLRPLNDPPRRALIFSMKFPAAQVRAIREACAAAGIEVSAELTGQDPVFGVERHMNDADIVFTRGRGAIEALACGRIVIVPGDGALTPANLDEIQTHHFSGRRFARPVTRDWLLDEVRKCDATMGTVNRALADERFSVRRQARRLEEILEAAVVRGAGPSLSDAELEVLGRFATAAEQVRTSARTPEEAGRRQEALVNVHRSPYWKALRCGYGVLFHLDDLVSFERRARVRKRLLPPGSRRRRLAGSLKQALWTWLSR